MDFDKPKVYGDTSITDGLVKCIILDHKLQRMLNDSKIGQLNSERPLHQTAVYMKDG